MGMTLTPSGRYATVGYAARLPVQDTEVERTTFKGEEVYER